MIAIRVNSSFKEGIGHLVRMVNLAKEFQSRNIRVIFLIDTISTNSFLEDFEYIVIDSNSEEEDAHRVKSALKNFDIKYVIVDSYLLGKKWEEILKDNYSIIAFDDLAREHSAHYVIDGKYCKDFEYRYDGKVSNETNLLLGPQYKIFSNEFKNFHPNRDNKIEILFSLGGGGDFSILSPTINSLAKNRDYTLHIVVGPYSKNYENFTSLPNVKLHKNLHSLMNLYKRVSLFIGALGGSFFEATLCKIPAITFPIADNQENNISDLEAFGQYLYLPLTEAKSDFSKLVETAVLNISRLKSLLDSSTIKLDPYGAVRIADAILNKKLSNFKLQPKKHQNIVWQNKDIKIREVEDSDINHYLDSRNLPANQENMNITQTIPRTNHYIWWFNNKRESYLLTVNEKKKLYIWHQQVVFNKKSYLIGGWFVCEENIELELVMLALNWQLEYSAKNYPKSKWIAIIKKTNRFVNLLNRRAGFVTATNDEDIKAIEHFFKPKKDKFNYVILNNEK
jgi:UDP-2,4-diacetamido-2,4,6-trideoxy-beta-L-altropyranose hydrolase